MENNAPAAAEDAAAPDFVGKAAVRFAATGASTAPPAAGVDAAAGAGGAAGRGQAPASAVAALSYMFPPTAERPSGQIQQRVEQATTPNTGTTAAAAAQSAQDFPGVSLWQRDNSVHSTSPAAHTGGVSTAIPSLPVSPPQQQPRQQEQQQSAPQQQQRQQRQHQVTPPAAALSCFGALARRREVAKEAAAAASAAQAATGANAAAPPGGGEGLAGGNGGTSQQQHRRSLRVAAGQLEEATAPQSLEWWKICFPTFASYGTPSAHDPASARLQPQQAQQRQVQPQQQPWMPQQQQLHSSAAGGGGPKSSIFSPLLNVSASPPPPLQFRPLYHQVPLPPARLQTVHLRQRQESGGLTEDGEAPASMHAAAQAVWGGDTSSTGSSSALHCGDTCVPPAAATGTMHPEAGAPPVTTAPAGDAVLPAARVLATFPAATAADRGTVRSSREDRQWCADGKAILAHAGPSVPARSSFARASTCSAVAPAAAAPPFATACAGLDSAVLLKPRPLPYSSSAVDFVCPVAAPASARAAACARAATSAPASPSLSRQQMPYAYPLPPSPSLPAAAATTPAAAAVPLAGTHPAAAGRRVEERVNAAEGAPAGSQCLPQVVYTCAGSPIFAVLPAEAGGGGAAAAPIAAAGNGRPLQPGESSVLITSHSLLRPPSFVRCAAPLCSAAPSSASSTSGTVSSPQQQPWQQQLQQLLSLELPVRNSNSNSLHVGGSPSASPFMSKSNVQGGSNQIHNTPSATNSSPITTNSGSTSRGARSNSMTRGVAADESKPSMSSNSEVAAGVTGSVGSAPCGAVVSPVLGLPTVLPVHLAQKQMQQQQQRQEEQREAAAAADKERRSTVELHEPSCVNSSSTTAAAAELVTVRRPPTGGLVTAANLSSSNYLSRQDCPNGGSSTRESSSCLDAGGGTATGSSINGPAGIASSISSNLSSSRGARSSSGSVCGDSSSTSVRQGSLHSSVSTTTAKGTLSNSGSSTYSSDCGGSGVLECTSVSDDKDVLTGYSSVEEAADYFFSSSSSAREPAAGGLSTAAHRWTPPWCITTVTGGLSEPQQGPRHACRKSGATTALPSPQATAASSRSAAASAEGSAGAARSSPLHHRPAAATAFHRAAVALPRAAAAALSTAACSATAVAAGAPCATGLRGALAAGRSAAAASSSGTKAPAAAVGSWEEAHTRTGTSGLLEVEDLLSFSGGSDADVAAACAPEAGDDLLSLEQLPPANLAAVTAARLQPDSMSLRLLQQLLGTLLAGNATVGELTPVGFHVAWMGYQYLQQLQQNPKALLLLVKQQQQQQMQQLQQHAGRCRPAQSSKQQHGLTSGGAGAAAAKGSTQTVSRGGGSATAAAFSSLKQQQQRSTPQQLLGVGAQHQILTVHSAAGVPANTKSRAASPFGSSSGKYASTSAAATAGANASAKGPSLRTSVSRSPSPLSAAPAEGSSGHLWRGGSGEKSRSSSSCGIPEHQQEKNASTAAAEGGTGAAAVGGAPPAAGGRGRHVAGDAVSRSPSGPSGASTGGKEEQERQQRQEQQQRRRTQIKKAPEIAAAPLWQTKLGYTDEEWPRYLCGTIDRRWVLQQRNATVPMLQDCNAPPRGRPCKNSGVAAVVSRSAAGGGVPGAATKRETAAAVMTKQFVAAGAATATKEETGSAGVAAAPAARGSTACAGAASGCVAAALTEFAAAGDPKRGAPAAPFHQTGGVQGAAGAECAKAASEVQQQKVKAKDAKANGATQKLIAANGISNPMHTAASASVLTRQDSKSSLYGGQAETGAGPATAHGAAAAVVPEEQEQQQRGPNMQQIPFGDDRTNDATSNDGSSTRSINNSGNQRTVEGGKGRVSDERESNKCEATTAAEGPRQTAAGGGFAAVGADTSVTTAANTCSANPAPEGCNAAALVTPAADGGSGRTAALRNDAAAASGVPATHRPTGSRNSSSSNTSNKGKQRTCLSQYEVSVQFEEFSTVAAELMWPDPLVLPERLYPGLAVQIAYEVRGRFGLWWTDAVLTEVDEAAGLVRCCYVSQHEQDRQQREEERREEKRHQQQRHLQQTSDTDAESSGNVELEGIRCSIDRSDSCNKSNKDRGSSALADVSGRSSNSAAKEAACTTVGGEGVADDDGRGAATAAPAKGAPLLNAARGAAAGEATAGATAGADTSATATAGAQQQPRTVLQVKGEKATAGSPQRSRSSRRSSETCDIIGSRDAKQQRAPAPPPGQHHPRQQQNQAEEQQQQQQLQQQGQQFCVGASGLPGFEGARAKPTQTLLVRDFCAPQVPVAAPAAHAWRLLPRAFDPAKDLHPGAVISVSAVAVSLGAAPAPAAQAATGGGAFAAGQKTRRGYAAAIARWHRAQASPAEAAATSEGTEARRWEVTSRKQPDLTSSMAGRAAEAATESRPRTAAAAAEREAREGCGSAAEEECGRSGRGAARAGWPQQQAVPPYLLRDAVIHRVFQCHTPKIIEAHNALRQQQQKHRKQQPHGEHQHQPRRDCASPGEEREDESHVSNSEMQASGRKPLCSGSTGRSSSSRDSSLKGGMEESGKEPEPGGSGPDARKGPRGRPPGAGAAVSAAAAASARAVAASGAGGLQQAGNCHPASASGSAAVDVAGGNAGAAADQPQNTSAAAGAASAALVTMPAVLAEEEAVTARTLTDAAEVAARTRGDGGGVRTGRAAPSEETAAATAKGSLGTAVLGVSPRRPRGRPRKTAVVAEGEENCSTKSSNNSNSSKSCTSSSSGCGSSSSRASRSSSSPGRSGSRLVRDADKRQQQEKRQEEKQRQRQQNHGVWKRGSTRGGAWLKSRTRSSSSSSQHHSGRSPLSKCSRLTRGRGAVTKGVCVSSRAVHTHQVAAAAVSPRRPTAAAAARRSTSPRPKAETWAGTAGSDIGATAAAAAEEEIAGEKAGSVKRIRRSLCHAGGNVDDRSQQQTTAVTTVAEHSRELAVAPRPAAVEEEGGRRAGLKRNRESTAVPEFPTAAAAACGAPSNTPATKEDAAAGTAAAAPAGEAPCKSSRFIHVSAASASKEKDAATGGERPAAIAVDTDGIVAQSERGTRALLQGSSSSVSGSSSNPPHSSSTYRSSSSGSLNSSSTLVDGSGALPGSGSSSPLSSSSSTDLCPSSRRAQQCYNGLVSEDCSRRPAGETQEEGAADTSPVTYVLLYFPYGDQQRLVSLQRLLNFPCYRLPYDLHAHFPPESGQSVLRQARDFLWAVPRALLPPAAAVAAQCRAANAAALAVANVSTAAASGTPAGGTLSAGNVTAEAGAAGRAATETGATTAQAAEPGTTAAAVTDGGRPGQATAAPKGTGDGVGATVPAVCDAGTAVTGRAAGGSGCEATAAEHANVETATMEGLGANTAAAAEVRVGIPPAAGGSVAAPVADVGAGAAAREWEVGLAVATSMQAESSAAARPPWTPATAAAAMQKQAAAEGEAATTGSTLQRICKSEGTVETQQNGGKHTGVPATAGNSSSSSATRNPSSHTKRQTSSKSGLTENGSSKTSSVFCGSFESTGRARLAESGSSSHSNAASPDSAAAVSRSRSKSVEPQQHRRSPGCSAASGSRRNINKQKDDDGVKEEGKATPEGLSQSPFSLVYVALEDSPFKLPQHMHLLQVLQPELDFAALFEGRWQRLLPQWRRRSSASFLEAVPLFHARAAAAEAATAAAADAVASVSSVAAAGTAGACTAATALLSAHHNPTGATAVEPTAVISLCRAAAVCGAAGTGHCASAAGTQQTAAKAATPGATADTPLSHAVTQENQPGIAAAGNMHGRSFPSGATRRNSALVANSAFASASGSVGEDVAALYASLRPAAAALFRPSAAVALPLSIAVASRLPPAAAAAAARLTAVAAAAFPAAAAAAPWSSRGKEALQAVTTAFASLLESPSAADVAAASTAASRRNFPCLLHHPSDGPPAPWMCTVALSSWIRAGWKPYMLPASFIPRSCASAAVAAAVAAVTTARCTALDVVVASAAEAALPAGVSGTSARDTTDGTHSSWRTSNGGADSSSTQSSSGNKSGSTTLYARDSSFLAKVNADEASRGNPFSGVGETAGDLLHSDAAWKRMQSEQQVAATTQQRTAAETTLRSPGTAADGLRVQVGHEEKSSSPAADSSAVSAAAAGGAPAVATVSPLRTALSNEYLSKPQGPFRSTATGRARGSLSPGRERKDVVHQLPQQHQQDDILHPQQHFSQQEMREVERGVRENVEFGPTVWPWAQVETLGGGQQDASVGWTWAALTVYEELLLLRLQQQQQAAAAAAGPHWQLSAPYRSATETFIRKVLDGFPAQQQEEEDMCSDANSGRAWWPTVTGTGADADAEATQATQEGLLTRAEGAAFASREKTFGPPLHVTESSSGREEQVTATGSRNRKRPLASAGAAAATGAVGEVAQSAAGRRSPKPEEDRGGVCGKSAPPAAATAAGRAVTAGGRGAGGGGAAGGKGSSAGKAAAPLAGAAAARTGKKGAAAAGEGAVQRGGHVEGHVTSTATPSPCSSGSTGSSNSSYACTQRTAASGERSSSSSSIETLNSKNQQESQQTSGVTEATKDHAALNMHACIPAALVRTRTPLDVLQSAAAQLMREKTLAAGRPAIAASSAAAAVSGSAAKAAMALSSSRAGKKGPTTTRNGGKKSFRTLLNGVRRITTAGTTAGPRSPASTAVQTGGLVTRAGGEGDGGPGAAGRTTGEQSETLGRGAPGILRGGKKTCGVGIPAPRKHTRDGDTPKTGAAIKKKKEYPAVCATPPYAAARSPHACSARRGTHRLLRKPHGAASHAGRSSSIHNSSGLHSDTSRSCSSATQRSTYLADGGPKSAKEKRQSLHSPRAATTRGGGAVFATAACFDDDLDSTQFAEVRELRLHFSSASVSPPDDVGEATAAADSSQRPAATLQCDGTTAIDATAAEGSRERRALPGEGRRDRSTAATEEGSCATVGRVSAAAAEATKGRSVAAASRTVLCAAASASVGACSSAPAPQRPAGLQRQRQAREKEKNRDGEGK